MDDLNNYVDNPLDLCKMIIEEKQNEYGDAWQDHCSKEEIETLERYWGKFLKRNAFQNGKSAREIVLEFDNPQDKFRMANNIKRQFAADEEKGFNGMSVGKTDTGWPVTIQESAKLNEAKNIIAYLTRKGFYNYLNEDIIFINDRWIKPLDVILCLDERGATLDQIIKVLKRYISASKEKLEQEDDKDKNKWSLLQMDLALRSLIEERYKLNYGYILNESANVLNESWSNIMKVGDLKASLAKYPDDKEIAITIIGGLSGTRLGASHIAKLRDDKTYDILWVEGMDGR